MSRAPELQPLDVYEAWFVAGSQTLYGEANLRKVGEHSAQLAGALDGLDTIPVRVVQRPTATSAEAILQLCREANSAERCVGVIAWMHTFSPAKMWIAGLTALQKPLLHLHTQFNRDLPWAEIDMEFMNLAQSAHGDREFGYLLTRMGSSRKTVVGHVEDPSVGERIGLWTRAAVGWREAHELRVARFGDNMRDVAVTEGDKVDAQIRLGFSVNGYGINELAAAVAEASDAETDAIVAAYDASYDVAAQLRPGGERRESLRDAARIEAGLRSVLAERRSHAFTTTFEDLGELTQLPGIAVQRLMSDGFGFGAEGDWKTAALLRMLKVMAVGLPGGTSFMEDYTYDLVPGASKVLGAHMLEVCPSIAAARPTCEIHPLSIGGRADPVRLVFTAAPGPAINLGLIDLGGRFRLLANKVEVVLPDEDLPNLPVARALWEPRPEFATAAEAWLIAGGPHHTVLTTALGIEPLIDLAEIAGIELVVIDEQLSIPAFKNELRWNHAYHRLAGGL
jgi:L-arabinose isomerase